MHLRRRKYSNVITEKIKARNKLDKANNTNQRVVVVRPNQIFRPIPVYQEPKRNNRFVIDFCKIKYINSLEDFSVKNSVDKNSEIEIPSYLIQNATKPCLVQTKNENYKWKDLKFTFIDVIAPSTTQLIYNFFYGIIDSYKNDQNSFNKKWPFNITLKALDPVGVEVETWNIFVKNIKKIDFGKLDYSSNDLQTITMVVEPYKCILVPD